MSGPYDGSTTLGYQPRRPLLGGDLTLKLDPSLEAWARTYEIELATLNSHPAWMKPSWLLLSQSDLVAILGPGKPVTIFVPPPGPGGQPATPPPNNGGPAVARPADVGNVLDAVTQLPSVQKLLQQTKEEGMRQLRILGRDFSSASFGDKTLMITFGGVVAGSTITAVLANKPSRDLALGAIMGKDLPVPGIAGLTFNMNFPGLLSHQGPAAPWQVGVGFDIAEFMRSRQK